MVMHAFVIGRHFCYGIIHLHVPFYETCYDNITGIQLILIYLMAIIIADLKGQFKSNKHVRTATGC